MESLKQKNEIYMLKSTRRLLETILERNKKKQTWS